MIDRWLQIKILVKDYQPELLEGLENWLNLGLISENKLKEICEKQLICPLPQVSVQSKIPVLTKNKIKKNNLVGQKILATTNNDHLLSNIWQAFKDELSIRWLLFLGLFLVVISSGVLAATQWSKFPPFGQYLVLWTYTVIFWGVGFWASEKEDLKLTSQTLQTIGILLLPLNFWAMDSFRLWSNFLGWLVIGIGGVILSFIYYFYRRQKETNLNLIYLFLFLALSYLQLGWEIPRFPLIAIYSSSIISAFVIPFIQNSLIQNQGLMVYALSILLMRGIFIESLPIQTLGLAIGILGWLLTRNIADESTLENPPQINQLKSSLESPVNKFLQILGIILQFIGWLVCVGETTPWQATFVSGLALHCFAFRLQKYWLRKDLLAIFIIGFQLILLVFLGYDFIPDRFMEEGINIASQIYIIGFVWLTGWLYRQEKIKLVIFGELLFISLGIGLTLFNLYNPFLRSLNLLITTATIGYITNKRHQDNLLLIYITQTFGLLTITATIDWWFKPIPQNIWAIILLGLMLGEWLIGNLETHSTSQQKWYKSCWNYGFVLATISYLLLLDKPQNLLLLKQTNLYGNLWWLLTPLTLTIITSQKEGNRRFQSGKFSLVALVFAQFLTLWQLETRWIGLGIATVLMFINTYYLRHLYMAMVNIGFVLGFLASIISPHISNNAWYLVGGIAIFILWQTADIFQKPLGKLYGEAANNWGILLSILELGIFSFYHLSQEFATISPHWEILLAFALITFSIINRYRKQLNDIAVYGICWGIEICLVEIIRFGNGNLLDLAIGNIFIALATLFLTNKLLSKQSSQANLFSLKILPLIYGILAIYFRWDYFTAYTGLITFGSGVVGLGVGCRDKQWKSIRYLSLAFLSLSACELAFYQITQAEKISLADNLTILAIVTAIFALIYRSFVCFLNKKRKAIFLNLTTQEIKKIAHIHWGISSILNLISIPIVLVNSVLLNFALVNSSQTNLTNYRIILTLILAAYALIQGRNYLPKNSADNNNNLEKNSEKNSDWWIYIGLLEILTIIIYTRLIYPSLSFLDSWWVIIASGIALLFYQIPWETWGWKSTPWHRVALVIPTFSAFIFVEDISYLSLLTVSSVYLRLWIKTKNIRWSYLSLAFFDWGMIRFLIENDYINNLWYAFCVGFYLLYIAQFDPFFTNKKQRKNRHYLRILGSGIICLVALIFYQETGLTPGIISLIFVFLGLGLQIRAFLFVGTINFILTVFYQLVFLIFTYSFLKWALVLICGIALISFAAYFEKHRDSVILFLQNWFAKLRQWE